MAKKGFAVLPILVLVAVASCEIDTSVTVDGKNPPSFRVSGSGGINFVRIVDVSDCKGSLLDCPVLWQIDPAGGQVAIADLPAITYGHVPPGFHQTTPSNDAPPPPLVDGKTYTVYTPTYNANGGGVRFTIVEGKSVELR